MYGCSAVTLLMYHMIVGCEEERNIGHATDSAWFIARGSWLAVCLCVCVVNEGFLSLGLYIWSVADR